MYQAYGLNICSDFELPELLRGGVQPDIYFQTGKVKLPNLQATSIHRQGIEAHFGGTTQEAYLRWSGVSSFLAKNGTTLIIEPDSEDIDPELLKLYILSEALGLILHQRGFFLLHASAVKIGDYAVVIVGAPGAGKSTMAAAFAKYGYPVLADDMVAISNIESIPTVYPAYPQIKIWSSAVQGLEFNLSNLPRLFSDSEKRVIRQTDNFTVDPCPLVGIFALDLGEGVKTTQMLGTEAFATLTRFFPCPPQLLQQEALEKHFGRCIQLLENTPVFKIERPKNFSTIAKVIKTIERQVNSIKNDQNLSATV